MLAATMVLFVLAVWVSRNSVQAAVTPAASHASQPFTQSEKLTAQPEPDHSAYIPGATLTDEMDRLGRDIALHPWESADELMQRLEDAGIRDNPCPLTMQGDEKTLILPDTPSPVRVAITRCADALEKLPK